MYVHCQSRNSEIFFGMTAGVARGCGWQEYAAYANLGAFYCIGMPTAVILAFVFHLNGWVCTFLTKSNHHILNC